MLRVFPYYPGMRLFALQFWTTLKITLTAINIEHKTERTGAFVSLVFGYSVVALLYQNTASFGMNAYVHLVRLIMGNN